MPAMGQASTNRASEILSCRRGVPRKTRTQRSADVFAQVKLLYP